METVYNTAMNPSCALILIAAIGLSFPSFLSADPNESQTTVIPKGSVIAGKTLFVEKGCYQRHAAGDISLPQSALTETLIIELGSDRHVEWTRDDFAKAIMNANHTVSPDYEKAMMILGDHFKAVNSPMPTFNDILTVSDLIHLTTFLDDLFD